MHYYDPGDPRLGDIIFHAKKGDEEIYDIRHQDKIKDHVGVICDILSPNHGALLQYGIKVQMLDGSIMTSSSREWKSFKVLENFIAGYVKEKEVMRGKLEVMSDSLLHRNEQSLEDTEADISM